MRKCTQTLEQKNAKAAGYENFRADLLIEQSGRVWCLLAACDAKECPSRWITTTGNGVSSAGAAVITIMFMQWFNHFIKKRYEKRIIVCFNCFDGAGFC